MNNYNYSLGPITFEIRGEGAVCTAVRDEMRGLPSSRAEPDIVFIFQANIEPSDTCTVSNFLHISPGRYEATHSLLHYSVTSLFGKPTCVVVTPYTHSKIRRFRATRDIRSLNWNYLSLDEIIAKNFIYDIFDYLTQLVLTENNATYIHASAIERNGQALLIAGRGGVGKSTLMLKSVLEMGYNYLSDDLAIIDALSNIFLSPKKMQIYGYNVANEPILGEAFLKHRSWLDVVMWHARLALVGGKRVRRRTSSDELFGRERITQQARVKTAVFLERHTGTRPIVNSIELSDFAYRCATILVDELSPFSAISLSEHSATTNPILPSISDLQSDAFDLISKSLCTSKLVHIKIPLAFSPTELINELTPLLP